MNISIRQLNPDDWRRFSAIRLKALQSDPLVFGSNYEAESKFAEADWRRRLAAEDSAIFMLFAGEKPIGITGVSVWRDDPANKTAIFWGSWLAPEFRRRGLSKLMYETRLEWVRARPNFERIIVSHRASNVASKYANQKHGFVFTRAHEKIWADGATEQEVCYELKLKS
ncbi:MAG TPA: GNAT family N-acetyltransferase [Pyrinomonadaceae bacterium]|jgi:RimJ/RimL family protein N-acetyltransferase